MRNFAGVLAVLFLVACSGTGSDLQSVVSGPSCAEESAEYIANVEDLIQRWDDANAIANNTARIALSEPVSELQALRREAANMTSPTCAEEVHEQLLRYMNLTIDSYLAFMSESEGVGVDRANEALGEFVHLYAALKEDRLDDYEPQAAPTVKRSAGSTASERREVTYEIESDAPALIVNYIDESGRSTDESRHEPPWPEPIVEIPVGENAHIALSGIGSGEHHVICRIKLGDEVLDEERGDVNKKVICNARIPED